jgi:hypothetical protein
MTSRSVKGIAFIEAGKTLGSICEVANPSRGQATHAIQ